MTDKENILLEMLENENMEPLTNRGRGAVEKYCSWIGRSNMEQQEKRHVAFTA